MKDDCRGLITCLTEPIGQVKQKKTSTNKTSMLLQYGGVNLAARGKTLDNDDLGFKIEKKNDSLSLYNALNLDKDLERRNS